MKNLFFAFLIGGILGSSWIYGSPAIPPSSLYSLDSEDDTEIVVHNRVLLKMNGDIITIMDVVRRMDLIFYRNFPQLASSNAARYQFYLINWKSMLRACMDDQLIIADAEEKEIKITDGEVREELESLFGPEVVLNVQKAGLSFEEAWDMLKKELIVRRMTGMMVKAKAMQGVTPKSVRKAYEELIKANPICPKWRYRILSIRSDQEEKNQKVAELAYRLLEQQHVPFEDLPTLLQKEGVLDSSIDVRVSSVYEQEEKDISLSHKSILQALEIGAHSLPLAQKGKKANENVTRLFYLVGKEMKTQTPLNEVESKLHHELLEKEIAKYSEKYLDKLYDHFGVTQDYLNQMIPQDFVPFSVRKAF
jgi:hypothetical protein